MLNPCNLLGKQQIWRCGVVVFIHLLGIYDILTSPRLLHHIKPLLVVLVAKWFSL